jgi:hypothetical protein
MSDENIDDCDLFLYSPASLDDNQIRLAQHGIKILQRVVEAFEPDVLVIDTWRLIVGDLDENKAETVVNALRSLSTVRQTRPDLVIFLVHHLRKQSPKGGPSLRTDPYTWVESVSGHHALVAHVDCCYGLEREIEDGEEVIVFGGVARNADSHALLLEDDPETLRFEPRTGESSLLVVLTPKEKEFWAIAKQLGRFTFTDLLLSAQTKNKKALSAMLTKAGNHGLVRANGKVYEICEDALDT